MQPEREIESLLDELEDVVEQGKTPFMDNSGNKTVDAQEIFSIIDEIRERFPTEFQEARRTLREREEILVAAQQQADSIIYDAQQQAVTIASDQEIVRLAQMQADDIHAQAAEYERETRHNAEEYAERVLGSLEDNLRKMTDTVDGVLRTLQENSSARGSERGAR